MSEQHYDPTDDLRVVHAALDRLTDLWAQELIDSGDLPLIAAFGAIGDVIFNLGGER